MKHLRKQIAGYLLTLILLMAGIVFPGSGEKVLASGGSMTVHFLDVGQGLSILVQSEGQNLLYDGGPRSASSYVAVSYTHLDVYKRQLQHFWSLLWQQPDAVRNRLKIQVRMAR